MIQFILNILSVLGAVLALDCWLRDLRRERIAKRIEKRALQRLLRKKR